MANSAGTVLQELKHLADPRTAKASQWFFKTGPGEYGEGDVFLGIRVPDLRKVARRYDDLPAGEIARLLKSRFHEARLTALLIMLRAYQRGDGALRERLFGLYCASTDRINNWDLVDVSAGKIVGRQLGPGRHALLTQWARSPSLWERRIAIIATQDFIRQDYFDETLRIARLLLHDQADLIHKAVGWMLREVGNRDRKAEEAFLARHCTVMPRTMLRYAIEKFPAPLRTHYLTRTPPRKKS